MQGPSPRAVLGASIVSACGSLPAQSLPLIIALFSSAGLWSLAQIGWMSGMLLIGQTVGSLAFPLYSTSRLNLRETLALAALSLAALTLSAFAGFAGNMLCWFVVGVCASGFQYVGLVTATQAANPSAAFSLRLAVALFFSSVVLVVSGLFPEAPALLVLGSVALAQAALVTLGALLAGLGRETGAGRDAAGPRGLRLSIAGWIIPCFGLLISFITFLPVSLGSGRAPHEVVLIMGLARMLAAPVLYAVQGRGSLFPAALVFWLFPLLSYAAFAGVLSAVDLVAVLCLFAFEVLMNTVSSRFLGEMSARHRRAETRWIGTYIQLGAGLAHVATGYALSSALAEGYFAVLAAAHLPLLWFLLAARRRRASNGATRAA